MAWIKIETEKDLPPIDELVWAYNEKEPFELYLAERYLHRDDNDNICWNWVVTYNLGMIYFTPKGNIAADTVFDDQYEFTHWHPLPQKPEI